MSSVDENGDGEISLDEFIALMTDAVDKHWMDQIKVKRDILK